MAPPTKQAVEVARQFRKAIALDLVTRTAQDAYDMLALTVQNALLGAKRGDTPNRQQVDAAKILLGMANMLEPAREIEDKATARMSLAELEALIRDLKVVDVNAASDAVTPGQPIDIFS